MDSLLATRTITIFEHEPKPFDWTDRDLAALDRLGRTNSADILRPVVLDGRRALQATQHVGVVRLGNRTIQILPKIYRAGEAESEQKKTREATRNLLHLLSYARQLSIREQELASLLQQKSNWFEILTRLFATHLHEEWQRGAYRTYQTVDDILPVLKGRWRISDQLRRPQRKHLFSVTYDEFTADNALNRVFRFVVERLWSLTRDAGNRQVLGELRLWMEDVTLMPSITVEDARTMPMTRLNQRFAPLLNLACLFLDRSTLQLAVGNTHTFAFVFDMNALFEAFISGFILRCRDRILSSPLDTSTVLPQARGATLSLARWQGHDLFRLKPDIAFRLGKDRYPLLIDTKYKSLDPNKPTLGVSEGDLYQMHAYAHRYRCPRVLLLYPDMADMPRPHPETADMPQQLYRRFHLSKYHAAVDVATINVRVDLRTPSGHNSLINRLRLLLDMNALEDDVDYSKQGMAG